ncbi:hypothetical protein COB55_01125 [Candidatus Wolfebacteria bacterium]|nr:MAG: hypothetical protein COB55_01125 [Candidatus Wolfebacteria bacterium]
MQKKKRGKTKQTLSPLEQFEKVRKQILKTTIVSVLLTFVSLAIVGLQLLYPFHIVIGVGIYVVSFIPFFRKIYISRATWRKYKAYKSTKQFIIGEKWKLLLGVLFIVSTLSFLVLRPLDSNVFKDMSDNEIEQVISDDMYRSVTSIDYLETSGNTLLRTLSSEREDANHTEILTAQFTDFLTAVLLSEALTDTHRYFGNIPYRLSEERTASFLISYSLYVKKYEIVHRLMTEVSGSEYKKKVLNQHVEFFDRGDIFNEMVGRFYEPKTHLRITGGKMYMYVFNGPRENAYAGIYTLLREKAEGSYKYLLTNFDRTIASTGEVLVDKTTKRMFDVWFPIQRGIANSMGHAIISTRGKEYFITEEQIQTMQQSLAPGDIMFQRRNWHVSNVGIPGFWTHSAMYTGTLSEMNEYFESQFPLEGLNSFSEYVADKFPDVYAQYKSRDEGGFEYSVIEAIEPGVVLQSLEVSAHADFVVVLRPQLGNADKMYALFKSFGHFGKPYDYNFDFDTRDALICSELIYDAYFEKLPTKKGLHFDTSLVNGRKIVTPLDMGMKYKQEYGTSDSELKLVYFLRGSEETQSASISTEAVFIDSILWSKFSFLQE